MKNIRNIVILIAFVGLHSCSEDTMQEINKNPNNPTEMAARLIITEIINRTSFTTTGADLALYASVYIEYNVGIWNQFYSAERRTAQPIANTTYNNNWVSSYSNLMNLKTIIEKCSPGGPEEENTVILGMAQVLKAYNLAILTDLFGDIPWSQALQPGEYFTPDLDSQEAIYKDIFQLLDDAIANLSEPSSMPAIGAQDPIFAGNREAWLRFAWGLKARYTMRLSHRTPKYAEVIEAASKSFTAKAQEARRPCSATFPNPFYRFFTDRDNLASSQSLHDKLALRNDPRIPKFFKAHPDADALEYAPNETPNAEQKRYGVSALSVLTAPIYLMSFHELEFLKAEAHARNGDLVAARTHLSSAISAAFTSSNVGLTAADATAYFTARVEPRLTNAAEILKEIMVQKYIGLYEIEAIETYNDIRRLKAMGQGDFYELANKLSFPLRFTYGSADVVTNENVRNAYGDGSYVYNQNVWWAGGTR